ncbi:MAG: hypothetical protein ABW221_18510 [Vicinamibacteria bacterium]
MRGALSRRMVVIGAFCALGIAAVLTEMLALLPYLLEEERERAARATTGTGISFEGLSIICPGLIGWLGFWGYLASWVWLPLAVWRVSRSDSTGRRGRDRLLPLLVALEILALQCVLRLTPLQREGYPLI